MGLFEFLGEEFSKKREKKESDVMREFCLMANVLRNARPDSAMHGGVSRSDHGWIAYVYGRNARPGEISNERAVETSVFLPDLEDFDRKTRNVSCRTIDEVVAKYEDAVKKKWIIRGYQSSTRLEIGIIVMNLDETVTYGVRHTEAKDLFRYLHCRGDSSFVYNPK